MGEEASFSAQNTIIQNTSQDQQQSIQTNSKEAKPQSREKR